MDSPKIQIYDALNAGVGAVASIMQQHANNVFTTLPVVSYYIANNSVTRDLENSIGSQNVDVTIDIWSETSAQGQDILYLTESAMSSIAGKNYRMDFSADVPNPNNEIYHITCRFTATNV